MGEWKHKNIMARNWEQYKRIMYSSTVDEM